MSTDVVVLAATGALAVVALVAALVTVRVARSTARDRAELRAELEARRAADERQSSERAARLAADALVPVPYDPRIDRRGETGDLVVRPQSDTPTQTQTRVVDGQVFVVPSQHDVVATALSRPATRVSVLVHGLAHALRPESRDRISALMRREYTRRRRERQRAARQAARLHTPSAAPSPGTAWVTSPDQEQAR